MKQEVELSKWIKKMKMLDSEYMSVTLIERDEYTNHDEKGEALMNAITAA